MTTDELADSKVPKVVGFDGFYRTQQELREPEESLTATVRKEWQMKIRTRWVIVAVLMLGLAGCGSDASPASTTSTTTVPTTAPTTTQVDSTVALPVSPDPERTATGWWPQSSLDEVTEAQELADAGDPDYTWQVDAGLASDDQQGRMYEGQVELVDRFLREELGWEAYQLNVWEGGDFSAGSLDGLGDGAVTDQRFLRCAPGRKNPLYPPSPDPLRGGSCAPTLDDLRYESVSLDLAQLDRRGPDGIWVVNGWRMTAPFAQADPAVVESQAIGRLEEFLAARIAGQGAEGYVQDYDDVAMRVPLLYATTSGRPYERFEIEHVDGPSWPYADMTFSVRLFADRGATVVEQEIDWSHQGDGELWMVGSRTTEKGQPVVVSYTYSDGEVTVAAPGPWRFSAWALFRDDTDSSEALIEFTDPVASELECAQRSSVSGDTAALPADAAAFAQAVVTDPNFDTTAPVAARVGGVEAVSIDIALAPGGTVCFLNPQFARWIYALEPGLRLRLYLVDLPEGMSMQTLAITVMALEARFEEVIEETAPIIESIEFHPG